jgi:hypothetical protein
LLERVLQKLKHFGKIESEFSLKWEWPRQWEFSHR